jgi:aminoglycoside phosphotransferase (APT) family kinase protein
VSPDVLEAVALATGLAPTSLTIRQRPAMAHQANRLYDVLADAQHLIAKQYVSNVELDAPSNEYRALRLVEHLDIAPRPAFFDPAVGPVVVYAYMDGTMWDRRVPSAVELESLAALWVALHGLPIEGLWVGRGQARNSPTLVGRLRAPIERYATWATASGDHARRSAARACMQVLERGLSDGVQLIPEIAPLCFCRSDARFANVIARPDGRVGLVDWEDSGLRDPARELVDLLHHPNQEDLLGPDEWRPFLDRYLPSRGADAGFAERVRGYLALFPVSWLGVLLTEGLRRTSNGTLHDWRVNDLDPNERLRRYVARSNAWPELDPGAALSDVADVTFFRSAGASRGAGGYRRSARQW